MTATSPQFNASSRRDLVTVQIASGASQSDAADLLGHSLVGIIMPSAWTAASLTFLVSVDGTTYQDLYDTSAEYAVSSAAASRTIGLPVVDFVHWRWLKVRSGTSASPVNQGGDRTLTLAIAPIISE